MRDCKRQVDLINDRSCVFVCIYLYMVHFSLFQFSFSTIHVHSLLSTPLPLTMTYSISKHECYRPSDARSHHRPRDRHMRWPSRQQHRARHEGSETGHGTCSVTFRQVIKLIKLTPFLETIVPLAEGQHL